MRKWFAILLAIFALLTPIAAISACGEAHEEVCADDCECVCHCLPPFSLHETTTEVFTPIAQLTLFSDLRQSGIIWVDDIFRPPLSA